MEQIPENTVYDEEEVANPVDNYEFSEFINVIDDDENAYSEEENP